MKTTNMYFAKVTMAILCSGLCLGNYAQTLYTGLRSYTHNQNVILGGGGILDPSIHAGNVGFYMGGYVPSPTATFPNFYVHKSDENGNFTGSTGEFYDQYVVSTQGTSCGGGMNQEMNCYGLSFIDITPVSSISYLQVSAYDSGIIYAGMNSSGAIIQSDFYPFTATASSPSKPLIAQSLVNPGDFYIAGSFNDAGRIYMYVMSIGVTGAQNWTFLYDVGAGTTLIPAAMIESPYSTTPALVTIVGKFNDTGAALDEGFFCQINGGTGAVSVFRTYGSGSATNEHFSSLTTDQTNGASHFYMGGYSDINTSAGTAWTLRTTSNGSSISWSTLIMNSSSVGAGDVVGVAARFSNAHSQTDYYACTNDNNGMMVLRMNSFQFPFSQAPTFNTNNEFVYNFHASTTYAAPVGISFMDTGSSTDGIHIYGTTDNAAAGEDFFLVQACFNGAAGATPNGFQETLTVLTSASNANISATTYNGYNVSAGILDCPLNFNITGASIMPTFNDPFGVTTIGAISPGTGIQNKAPFTSLSSMSYGLSDILVSPNPSSNKINIRYSTVLGGSVEIVLYNSLGQKVADLFSNNVEQGNHSLDYDLSELQIESGIYLLECTLNGVSNKQKLVFTN
jgi:hypothetical protein